MFIIMCVLLLLAISFLVYCTIDFDGVGGIIGVLIAIAVVALGYVISFAVTAGVVWLLCWAFDFTFTWKLVIGVFIILSTLSSIFSHK